MKKILLFLSLLQYSFAFSQTLLAAHPLELKKSKEYRQIINAENTNTQDVFALISDKEFLRILKYNSALFLASQHVFPRPDTAYKFMAGYSFNDEGNPTLYWSSPDLKNILAVRYELSTNSTVHFNYYNSFVQQTIITSFQENNTFYILAQKDLEDKLVIYSFKNGQKEERTIDFGAFKFKNSNNQPLKFSHILEICPVEKIETNQFNPLFKGTKKTKLYVLKNKLLLTLDHNNNETQAFEIDLSTLQIQEKIFPKSASKNNSSLSNSYYHENKIYQFKVNTEELLFEIRDYKTADTIKSIVISKTDTIPFKSSPLWLQFEGQKPKEFKTTDKFLNQLAYLEAGLTVYKTADAILITLGGTGSIQLASIINSLSAGNSFDAGLAYQNTPTAVYFETIFDKKLNQTKKAQEPLAVDFISGFQQEHPEVTIPSIIRYKNYYILGYYDSYAKQYTMRKFMDGFERSY